MIEIQQKSNKIDIDHLTYIMYENHNKQWKINCKKFVSKNYSDYFFTGVYIVSWNCKISTVPLLNFPNR